MKGIIKAVIFDMDGLLADTEPLHYRAWKETLKKYGIQFTEKDFKGVAGVGSEKTVNFLEKNFGLDADKNTLIKEKRERYMELVRNVKPMDGALELVRALKKRFKVSLASNSSSAQVSKVLEFIGLDNGFDFITTGEEVKNIKPAPDIYLLSAKKLGLKPAECTALEDSSTGVESAKSAGLKCIAVPNKYTKHHDFSKADMVVKSLRNLTPEKISNLWK